MTDRPTKTWVRDGAAAYSPDSPGQGWKEWDGKTPIAGGPVPATVSLRQLLFALRDGGWISHEEAMGAAKTGEMPATLARVLDGGVAAGSLTAQDAEDAALTWASLYTAERSDALWQLLVAAGSATAAQVDDLFRDAGRR